MASNKSTLAMEYDFDLFDTSLNTRSSAAPKIKTQPQVQPHIVQNKPRSRSELRREAKYTRLRALKVLAISAILLILAGSLIYSRVVLFEIGEETKALTTECGELESENIRLKSQVDSMYSIGNISSYAEDKLGMIKKDSYQVNYFSVVPNTDDKSTDE